MHERLSTALVAEFIGTFALIFVGAGVAALGIGGLVGVAFAHGLVVLAFAYAYGHISGTHINPAVSIAVWAAGKMGAGRAFSYVVFQLLGGIAAGFALRWCLGGTGTGLGATVLARGLEAGGTTIDVTPAAGFFLEAVLTFFLVNTVLNAAVSGQAGRLSGLAVGMTLTLGILLTGPLTGGSLNPARTLGPAMALGSFPDLWVYLVGTVVGGLAAAALYRGVFDR